MKTPELNHHPVITAFPVAAGLLSLLFFVLVPTNLSRWSGAHFTPKIVEAYEVGFDDPAYFSRAFHEEFGVPPSGIRMTEN